MTIASATCRSLKVVGVVFLMGIYPLTVLWPSGWAWHHQGQSMYLQMILGVYATLGVFLILAARDPLKNLSQIWFTVWSSVVHGAIMGAQALVYPEHRGHLLGDVPALFIVHGRTGIARYQRLFGLAAAPRGISPAKTIASTHPGYFWCSQQESNPRYRRESSTDARPPMSNK